MTSDVRNECSRVLAALQAERWAITREAMETMVAIATRTQSIEAYERKALAIRAGDELEGTRRAVSRGPVAVIPVHGPIFRYANIFTEMSGATSLELLAQDFGAAVDNPRIEQIVLDIDSPGGQSTGLSEFARLVRGASKPVHAHVGGMGASAAYWIAAAADQISTSDIGLVGSIGAIMTLQRSEEDNSITFVSAQSPRKAINPETEQGRSDLQKLVDDLASVFVATVAEFRGVDVDTVLSDFGGGGLLMGREALEAGMVDRIATLEDIIAGPGATTGVRFMSTKTETPAITAQFIAEQHPDIAAHFRAEGETAKESELSSSFAAGRAEGLEAGATAERQRIQDVLAQSAAGHEGLVQSLAFDGKTTGPEAAVQVLAAIRAADKAVATDRAADATATAHVQAGATAEPAPSKDFSELPVGERIQAEWDASAALRTEFRENFASYSAFRRAELAGKVKQIGRTG